MRTINISISDMEFNNLGIKNENITFTEFTELVRMDNPVAIMPPIPGI